MNEQAWKEQAARVLAASDGLNYDEVCGVDADPDNGYCDSGTCVAAFYEDHDADHARVMYNKHAAALYPLVQQAIAAERERCAKVAAGQYSSTSRYHEDSPFYGSDLTPDRSEFGRGVQRGREQAEAAIRSLKEADNGAGNECICPKCGLRHGGKVDSGAVF